MFYATNRPGDHLNGWPNHLRLEIEQDDGKVKWFYVTWLEGLDQANAAARWLNEQGIVSIQDALTTLIRTDHEF